MNPEAWAMESCNIRAKQQEQAEIAELTKQFLAAGGKIKRYTPDSRAVVDDTEKQRRQKIAQDRARITQQGKLTPKQQRFFDAIKRIAVDGRFNLRDLSESMLNTDYSEVKVMCRGLVGKYLITIDGDNGELL